MSRMSEWAWALEEHEPDHDLEMAAFHQFELEHQQQEWLRRDELAQRKTPGNGYGVTQFIAANFAFRKRPHEA